MGSLMQVTMAMWLAVAAADPQALEREAKQLEARLMAPCCWAQQVSLHQSPAADEIKQNIRRMLAEGKTSEQILDCLRGRVRRPHSLRAARPGLQPADLRGTVGVPGCQRGLVVVVIRRLRAVGPAPERTEKAAAPPSDDEAERIDEELRNLD